jgi:biotin/methionine sulfoxide reductase
MGLSFNHWGAAQVEVDGGRPVALRPVAADPDPSPILQNLLDTVDHPVRIRRPAIRRGFLDEVAAGRCGPDVPRRRGAEPFVEVGWDEALDLVARVLDDARRDGGNESIFAGSYGWASAGRFHHAQVQLFRFMNLIGGFTRSVNSYSYAAAEVILPHVVGDFFTVLAGHTSYEQLARHGRLVVAFGGLPSKNQQVENGGTYRHQAHGGLRGLRDAGIRLVNVSPVRSDVDPGLGAEWLPVRPGTDIALMLALCETLREDGTYGRRFLERCCAGTERFLASLPGHDAEWAAPICGIEADRIRTMARDLVAGPTLVTASWSLQRAHRGEHAYWALIALAAMVGQIGTPGGGFGLGYGSVNRVGSSETTFSLARLPVGHNPVDRSVPVARLTELLERRRATVGYDGYEVPLPDTRVVYWAGGNPFHHHQDLNRLVRAWQRPDAVIVHEQAWNALARHADVVLPVATTLERDDLGGSPLTGAVVANRKAVEPPGDARTDHQVFAALAERFGVREAFTEGLDEAGWLRRLWATTVRRATAQGLELPPFEALWEDGVVTVPPPATPRVLLAEFRADPDAHPLRTPSGRIELASDVLEAFAVPDCPSLPTWEPPMEWLGAPLAARFPLHLLSNQPSTRLHSQLDYGRTSQAGKVAGREALLINAADAAARGIAEGSVVRVFNDRGACLAGARVADDVIAGVVVLPTGAWYDPVEPGGMCAHGNPNVLTSDRPTSGLSQGPAPHSCLVEVEAWTGDVPPVRAFEPPPFVPHP